MGLGQPKTKTSPREKPPQDWSEEWGEERVEGRRIINDPAFDFSRGHLQRHRDMHIGRVLPDIFEPKIGEG